VRTVIGHLIKREGTLVVIQEADEHVARLLDAVTAEAEAAAAAAAEEGDEEAVAAAARTAAAAKERKRVVDNRVLAVNPNFVFES